MKTFTINPSAEIPATRDYPQGKALASSLPDAKESRFHPQKAEGGEENARLLFVGTATVILCVTIPGCLFISFFFPISFFRRGRDSFPLLSSLYGKDD